MRNEKKLQLVKRIVYIFVGTIIALTFLAIGMAIGHPSASTKKATVKKSVPTSQLSLDNVNHFLTEYYTKKDLSENRQRYKPLMTAPMYTQQVNTENQPVNQAYKGYIINQVYQQATIYLDTTDLTALCVVHYTNTQLTTLGSTVGEMKNQGNTDTILISYLKQGNQILVNNIQNVTFSAPLDSGTSNSYPEQTQGSSQSNSLQTKPNENVAITGGGVTKSSTQQGGK
jgi:hypothetical protein